MPGDAQPAATLANPQPAIRFCPGCGAGDALSYPQTKQLACGTCGFTLFLNAATAVLALIHARREGKRNLLVAVRGHDPAAFHLDMPGGFVDPGESVEEALLRELEEEIGGFKTVPEGAGKGAAEGLLVALSHGDLRYIGSFPNRYDYKRIHYTTCDFAFSIDVGGQLGEELPRLDAFDDVLCLLWLPEADVRAVIEGHGDEVKRRWEGHCDPRTVFKLGFPSAVEACKLWLAAGDTAGGSAREVTC
ncbi:NUDIX hydrolase domain-like protein [Hyaloraphidium curvatum]|nr:NUDIX hydrolase domain-like protein [Hyaloraphidium curvatum]